MNLDSRVKRVNVNTENGIARENADKAERKLVTRSIAFDARYSSSEAGFEWREPNFWLESESSLSHALESAVILYQQFIDLPEVLAVFDEIGINPKLSFIKEDETIYFDSADGPVNITDRLTRYPTADKALRNLAAAARLTGGELYPGLDASVPQWLRFHGFYVPKTKDEANNLLAFLQADLPVIDYLGNYWDQINGHDSVAVALSDEEKNKIRTVVAQLVRPGETLLDTLYEAARLKLSMSPSHDNADQLIADMLTLDSSQVIAKRCVKAMQWYGSHDDEDVSKEELAQLLVTAMILELDPQGLDKSVRHTFADYDIYGHETSGAGLSAKSTRLALEQYLTSKGRVSQKLAPIASHLLLAGIAPELIVREHPAELLIGSVNWVLFAQAVGYLELTLTGASRSMTFDQVMAFAALEPVNEAMNTVQGIAATEAINDWAVVNGVISRESLTSAPQESCEKASSAYQTFATELVRAGQSLSAPLPSRKKIALKTLKELAPGCDFLEEKIMRHSEDKFGKGMKMTILDLHIEGDMQDWDRWETPSLHELYPGLYWNWSNQALFKDAIAEHHRHLQSALVTNVKLAMSLLPADDRDVLKKSKITFFTVRPPAGEQVGTSASATGLVGVNQQGTKLKETQLSKDQNTGRYGVVLCASHGGKVSCYEVFTLRGECRKNDELGRLINGSGRMNATSRIDFKGSLTELTPAVRPFYLPIDINSYIKGSAPEAGVSGHVVVEKLGVVEAPTVDSNTQANYFNPQFEAIAQFIAQHRFFASVEELTSAATVLTEREEAIKTFDERLTFVLDLIVPFKKCSEDLSSGERDKIVDGLYGCLMDAIGLVFTALGAVTKTLNTLARIGSAASKAVSLAKFTAKATFSVFNPLDGVPTLAYNKINACYRTGLRLSAQSVQLIERTSFQLRRLSGKAKSVELLQASEPALSRGKWRPRGSNADALEVSAVLKNDQWYAASRYNRPWGKPLANFNATITHAPPRVRRSLPNDFVFQLIEQSLPLARTKIDNAITALTQAQFKFDTDLTLGLFLGSKASARERLQVFLRILRAEIKDVSIHKVFLDVAKDNAQSLSIQPVNYQAWKDAVDSAKSDNPYLAVNEQALTDRFVRAGYRYDEIADDLIQTLFQAGPGAQELASAIDAPNRVATGSVLNVSALLNLAAGHHPMPSGSGASATFDQSKALENADSYVLTVALLNQQITDKPGFDANMNVITSAIGDGARRPLTEDVLVSFSADWSTSGAMNN